MTNAWIGLCPSLRKSVRRRPCLCSCYVLMGALDRRDAGRVEPGRGATRNPTPTRFNLKERVERRRMAGPGRGAGRRAHAPDDRHHRASASRSSPATARPDIGFDRSVNAYPRLRARLHLLLRAADPRLSRPLAGRGFRNAAVREAQCSAAAPRRAVAAGLRMPADRDGHQHRSLSADRGAVADHPLGGRAAGRKPPPVHHHHQIRPRAARPRPAQARRRPRAGVGCDVGDFARSRRSRGRSSRARRSRASGSRR